MRNVALVLAAFSLVVAPSSRLAAQGFEGVIVFEVHLFGPPMTVTQMSKGSKLRIEGMGGPGSVMMLNGDKVITLVTGEKKYDERGVNDLNGSMKISGERVTPLRTGKIENVAGVPCEVWRFNLVHAGGPPEASEVCVAKNMGFAIWRTMGNAAVFYFNGSQDFVDMLMKSGGGMMKSTTNGAVQIVALKVEAKPIPDAMFAPPPGYTAEDMSAMTHATHKP